VGRGGLDAIEPGRSSNRGWGSHARGAQPASLPREVAHDGEAAHPRHRPPDCPNQAGARRSAPWTAGSHERRPEDGPCRQPPLSSTHVQQQPGSPSAAGTGGAVDPKAGGADLAPGKAAEQPPPATGRTSVVGHGWGKGGEGRREGVGTSDAHGAGCSELPLAAAAGRPGLSAAAAVARVWVGGE
jgi:hypothetical protein